MTGRAGDLFHAFSLLRCSVSLLALSGVCVCEALRVWAGEGRRFALLYQTVVLQCEFSSESTHAPVVQWWYKSFCHDRTRHALSFPNTRENIPRNTHLLKNTHSLRNTQSSEHQDCGDSERTIRIVASRQGSALTLAEHYRGRDITITNKADLRIGELQWGDSGVYFCKVVISDDVEGENEAHVELLVLGQTAFSHLLLPGFNEDIVPEWVFVCAVFLGALVLLLLVCVCWCQCCPHCCCCYVRCCCCPETCCCPRHLYEAGKGIRTSVATPVPVFPPFFVPGMPTMVPITPPSLPNTNQENGSTECNVFPLQPVMDTCSPSQTDSSVKMLDYVEKQLAQFSPTHTLSSSRGDSCSVSDLSSLHDAETQAGFQQCLQRFHKQKEPQRTNQSLEYQGEQTALMKTLLSLNHQRDDLHQQPQQCRNDDPRWKPCSELLQRRVFIDRERSGSFEGFSNTQTPRRDREEYYRGTQIVDHYQGNEEEEHFRGKEREEHYKCNKREDYYRGNDREGHYRGNEREGHFRGNEKEGHFRGNKREEHFRGNEREGHFRGNEEQEHYRVSQRQDFYRGSDREGHYRGNDREEHFNVSQREDSNRGNDKEGPFRGKDRDELCRVNVSEDQCRGTQREGSHRVNDREELYRKIECGRQQGQDRSLEELEDFARAYSQRRGNREEPYKGNQRRFQCEHNSKVHQREDDHRVSERERDRQRARELERDKYPLYSSQRSSPVNSELRHPPAPPALPEKPQNTSISTDPGLDPSVLRKALEKRARSGPEGEDRETSRKSSRIPEESRAHPSSLLNPIKSWREETGCRTPPAEDRNTSEESARSGKLSSGSDRSVFSEPGRTKRVRFMDESAQIDSDLDLSISVRLAPRLEHRLYADGSSEQRDNCHLKSS